MVSALNRPGVSAGFTTRAVRFIRMGLENCTAGSRSRVAGMRGWPARRRIWCSGAQGEFVGDVDAVALGEHAFQAGVDHLGVIVVDDHVEEGDQLAAALEVTVDSLKGVIGEFGGDAWDDQGFAIGGDVFLSPRRRLA